MSILHSDGQIFLNFKLILDLKKPFTSVKDRRIKKISKEQLDAVSKSLHIYSDTREYKYITVLRDSKTKSYFVYRHYGKLYPFVASELFYRYIPNNKELMSYVNKSLKFFIERTDFNKIIVDDPRLLEFGDYLELSITDPEEIKFCNVLKSIITQYGRIPLNKFDDNILNSLDKTKLTLPDTINKTDKILFLSLCNKYYSSFVKNTFTDYDITPLVVFNVRLDKRGV